MGVEDVFFVFFFFFQAEDGIRGFCVSRGLGDVYKETGFKVTVLLRQCIELGQRPSGRMHPSTS